MKIHKGESLSDYRLRKSMRAASATAAAASRIADKALTVGLNADETRKLHSALRVMIHGVRNV